MLVLVGIHPFRCAGCSHRFRAFRPGAYRTPRSMPRRAVDRVAVSIPCDVTTQDGVIAGTFVEISPQGGSVETYPVPEPGTEVSVVLHARTVARPVRIPSATVRWSRSGRFGLLFQTMSPEDTERLRQVVLTARGYAPGRARPRRRIDARPWIVVAVVSAAILVTLLFSLLY